jgi:hypothetical protein
MRAIRRAIRVVRRNPAFAALVVTILGVGVGATTAAMNVAAAILWNPLPVADDSSLVLVSKTLPVGSTNVPFTPAEMSAWAEASRTMDAVAGVQYDGAWPWPAQFDNQLEASPDIEAATPVLLRPFTGTEGWNGTFTREGQGHDEAAANPSVHLEAVRENYFSTMGIRIVQGRSFAPSDAKGNVPVAIIGESLARDLWPGSAPLGKRLKFGGFDSPAPWMTIVGIVGDLRYRDLDLPPPAIYVPSRQTPFPGRFLIVRARLDNAPVLSTTQRALKEIDPAEPVPEAMLVSSLLAVELAGPRFQMVALSLFAAIAVFLAGVGVVGVLAAFVAQRSREVGLRVALGATRADVRRLVLGTVGRPAALGLCVGTLAVFAATPWLRPLLFDVSGVDIQAFAAGWVMLILTSLVAAIIPLRRAARVDPAMLLRSE